MTISKYHEPFKVPAANVWQRIKRLQEYLSSKDIEVAWISHLSDKIYYTGSAQDGVLLVPTEGEPEFWVRKSVSRARWESPVSVISHRGSKALFTRIQELAPSLKLGIPLDVMPASTYLWISSGLNKKLKIIDIGFGVRTLRTVKDSWEQKQVASAAHQADLIFKEIPELVRPGMTELELTGLLESRVRALGHCGTVRIRRFGMDLSNMVLVSGESSLYPSSFDGPVGGEGPWPSSCVGAGWKPINKGDLLMVDMVTSYNGYYADNARTFFLGKELPDQVKEAHDFCISVLKTLEEVICPQKSCDSVYKEVQAKMFPDGEIKGFMGFVENRVSFLGHGVGLELDEFPVIAPRFEMILKAGMVIAMEPKVFLEKFGPTGVENTYVITKDGCQSLCLTDRNICRIS